MTDDQELSFFISRYEANPQDYDAVAALVKAYRARNMVDEAQQFEDYLMTLTPPPRKPSAAKLAEMARKNREHGTGPVTMTCCVIGVFCAMGWGGIYFHAGFAEVMLHAFMGFGLCIFLMLPAMVAEWRDIRGKWGVFVLALLLGGTIIGWLGALLWAACAQNGPRSYWQ